MKEALAWRYATQKYDNQKKVRDEDLNEIIHAINSAPTAFGLQPFQLIHVVNPALREQLRAVSYNQSQVTDASDLFIFTVNKKTRTEQVVKYVDRVAEIRNLERSKLSGYEAHVAQNLEALSEQEFVAWSSKQAYLAVGFGLVMAAQLGIDTTPMEGFQNDKYNELLQLDDQHAILALAIGYRAEDDETQYEQKVRKTLTQLRTIQ